MDALLKRANNAADAATKAVTDAAAEVGKTVDAASQAVVDVSKQAADAAAEATANVADATGKTIDAASQAVVDVSKQAADAAAEATANVADATGETIDAAGEAATQLAVKAADATVKTVEQTVEKAANMNTPTVSGGTTPTPSHNLISESIEDTSQKTNNEKKSRPPKRKNSREDDNSPQPEKRQVHKDFRQIEIMGGKKKIEKLKIKLNKITLKNKLKTLKKKMNTLKHGGTNYMNNIFDKKIAPIDVPTPPPEQLEAEKRYRNSLTKKKTPKIKMPTRKNLVLKRKNTNDVINTNTKDVMNTNTKDVMNTNTKDVMNTDDVFIQAVNDLASIKNIKNYDMEKFIKDNANIPKVNYLDDADENKPSNRRKPPTIRKPPSVGDTRRSHKATRYIPRNEFGQFPCAHCIIKNPRYDPNVESINEQFVRNPQYVPGVTLINKQFLRNPQSQFIKNPQYDPNVESINEQFIRGCENVFGFAAACIQHSKACQYKPADWTESDSFPKII